MIKCRACRVAAKPPPRGQADYAYMAAMNDAKLGIDPMLCEKHLRFLAVADNEEIIASAENWKVRSGQTKQES